MSRGIATDVQPASFTPFQPAKPLAGATIAESAPMPTQDSNVASLFGNEPVISALKSLADRMADMQSAQESTARSSFFTQRILERVTRGGDVMLTEAA